MAVKLPGDLRPRGYDVDQSCDYLAQDAFDEHARSCGHCQAALTEIREAQLCLLAGVAGDSGMVTVQILPFTAGACGRRDRLGGRS